MPYSIGTDRLEQIDPEKIQDRLSDDAEKRLEQDLGRIYDKLLPTELVEINRRKLVQKLEKLFNDEWPGHDIQVHLFGSSGNLLCSDDSDVDICITTKWKELESVCMIADLLDKHGMEKVVCVSSAKVPIVKIWDPELKLACDMNVNNTLALENTRMVRTYVEIDERVRPLAMLIKYWTRRRIVNDAAFGGTLSSYTWICLIIAFLQLREPPVLPALHQRHHQKLVKEDGKRSEFADDLDKLRGFGAKNKDTLAVLLFQFFRFYAHEFDYDKYALSIRLGKLLTKAEKRWHFGTNNMLCVEEPFNTMRNLGNTADDTSFRGLHIELRRAFDLIAEGKFDECCEEYVFPKEEERVWQKPASSAPRPILVRSSSQQHSGRGGRGGFRGGRQQYHRNGNSGRRASSSVAHDTNSVYTQTSIPATMNPPDVLWYTAHNPQLGVPQELLAATSLSLAAHETNLRFQLYTQAQQINQQQAFAHAQRMQGGGATQPADRSRTNSFDNPPLTAPIRPELMYGFGYPLQHTAYFHPGFTTYPSSPATTATTTNGTSEFRRSLHRNTATSESGASTGSGALRSQSQPASRTPMVTPHPMPGYLGTSQPHSGMAIPPSRQVNGITIPSFAPDEAQQVDYDNASGKNLSDSPPADDGPRYVGYYVNETSSPAWRANAFPNAVPGFSDLSQNGQGRRRLSTDQSPQSILDRRMKRTSRSPSPLGHSRAFSVGTNSAPLASAPFNQTNGMLAPNRGPLVVNGSVPKPNSTSSSSRQPTTAEPVTTEENSFDNPLYINQGPGHSNGWVDPNVVHQPPVTACSPPPFSDRPVIVNGSSSNRSPATNQSASDASFHQRMAMGAALQNGIPYVSTAGEMSSIPGFSPPTVGRSRIISRQQQNGIAPLDLATSDLTVAQDMQHLSPVYEHRTPSPTAVRRFETPGASQHKLGTAKEFRAESSMKSPPTGPSGKHDGTTRSPVLDTRTNPGARENGHHRGGKAQNENYASWQRQKVRKKGMADLKSATNGFPQGEQPPKNDADRKGG